MSIKNIDGTIFELRKPNPMMNNQELWSKTEKYVIHNRIGQRIILETQEEEKKEKEEKIDLSQPIIVEGLSAKKVEQIEIKKISIWCLPANIQETIDPLYQEKYRKIVYGNKFIFEGIIEEQQDLFIKIWTDLKIVTLGSIIYPKTYDKRWWRIESIEAKDGMFLLTGLITDYHPDFSDSQK
jgi:hypothetical protein